MKIKLHQGFTIIELMIAILVLALLITVAIPSFGSFIGNNRLTTQSNSFHSALLYTRSEAVKRNERVTMCWTGNETSANPCGSAGTGWSDGWIIFVDSDEDNQRDSTETILRSQESMSGGSTLAETGGASVIAYLSDGRAATGNLTFKFCSSDNNDAYTRELKISPLGSPRVYKQGTCP